MACGPATFACDHPRAPERAQLDTVSNGGPRGRARRWSEARLGDTALSSAALPS